MLTFSLQSGSNGNAIYVEAGDKRLLFDAGISGSCAQRRMIEHGRDIKEVDALIISHDHNDHIRGAGIFQRKFGLPVYVTRRTLQASWCNLGQMHDVRFFRSGETLRFGSVAVHTIPTQHDAVDGVAFVVEHEGKRLGILTDLGCPCLQVLGALEQVDAAYLESNYDPHMLEQGPYPEALKTRIRGSGGHLSNQEAAGMVKACGPNKLRWVALSHLSQENNHPELATQTMRQIVGQQFPTILAPRFEASPVLQV